TTTTTRSASAAPAQAAATMARSRRRFGVKMPGVSTKMICVVPSVATPRMRVRVVCTLGVTIDSLAPTSALSRVDLPALGAPTRATKPQRLTSASAMFAPVEGGEQRRGRRLFRRPLRAGGRGGRRVRYAFDAHAHREGWAVVGTDARHHLVVRQAEAAPLGPFLQRGLGVLGRSRLGVHERRPVPLDEPRGDWPAAVDEKRADHRLATVGERRRLGALRVRALALGSPNIRAEAE